MKIVWHMAANDLRRLRVPLALWVTVIAVKLGLGVLLLTGRVIDLRLFDAVAKAGNAVIALEVAVGYFLVAALLHSDVLVGTTAFWMTRPISGGRLLGSKLLGLAAIFGVIPILVTLPWWLACGYGVREVALASAETLLWQTLVVAVALPLAALTDGFSRYLVWSLVVFVAIGIANVMIIANPQTGLRRVGDEDLFVARLVLVALLFLIGGGVVVAEQFRSRRILRSFAILGATMAVVVVVMLSSSVGSALRPLTERVIQSQKAASVSAVKPGDLAAGVRLSFRGAQAKEVAGHDTELTVKFKVEGVPAGYFLEDRGAMHIWSWPDGLRMRADGARITRLWADNEPRWQALGIAEPEMDADYIRLLNERRRKNGLPARQSPEAGTGKSLAIVPAPFVARTRRDPPSYTVQMSFQMMRAVVAGELPARTGEILKSGDTVTRIVSMQDFYWTKGGVGHSKPPIDPVTKVATDPWHYRQLILVERWPALLLHGWFGGIGPRLSSRGDSTDYLVNRARGQAAGSLEDYPVVAARFGTVGIALRMLSAHAPVDWRGGKPVESAGWFDDPLTLARVTNHKEELFTRELRVERFEVESSETKGNSK